jgi:3-hydroxyacyl-[acyl-carrier-protein] dehydratase
VIGLPEIHELLPHRYPMLLVDHISEVVAGERLVAVKNVTVNEPWYAGVGDHPSAAELAYPDVLLVESFAQSAGVLCGTFEAGGPGAGGRLPLLGSVSGIKFHRKASPGDRVEHRIAVARVFDDSVIVEGTSDVGGETVMTVERMVLAFRPAPAEVTPHAESAPSTAPAETPIAEGARA